MKKLNAQQPPRDADELEPVDAENRTRAAKQARLRRRKAKLKAAKDERELAALMREELAEDGEEPRLASVTPITAAQPPPPPPGKPGWPPDELVEANKAHARTLWEDAARHLKGTRYELDSDQVKILVEGSAPVLAKYLPMLGDTPEASFAVALGVVFLPKLVAHVNQLMAERRKVVKLGNVQPPEKPAA